MENILNDATFKDKYKYLESKTIKIPVITSNSRPTMPGNMQDLEFSLSMLSILNSISSSSYTTEYGRKKIVLSFKSQTHSPYSGGNLYHHVATICSIMQQIIKDNVVKIKIFVESRCFIVGTENHNNLVIATVIPVNGNNIRDNDAAFNEDFKNNAKKLLTQIASIDSSRENIISCLMQEIQTDMNIGVMTDLIASPEILKYTSNQSMLDILSITNAKIRAKKILNILKDELDGEKILYSKIPNADLDRKVVIKRKIALLEEELNEENKDIQNLRDKIKKLEKSGLFPDIISFLNMKISHIIHLDPTSSDYHTKITHIHTVLSFPWIKDKKTNKSIQDILKSLNDNIQGMKDVKGEIIEILTMYLLSSSDHIKPICLLGDPGLGKTKMAFSIAKSLDYSFYKISLCGISDENVLKGSRASYVGASCGQIAQAMIMHKTNNKILILLDEIDKINFSKHVGIWSSIMEILDGNNSKFTDLYLDCQIDLSKVLFVATANNTNDIPSPLLDRMYIINMPSYSEKDKIKISYSYIKSLIEKLPERHRFQISDNAVKYIVSSLKTNSIRELELSIHKIIRKHLAKNITVCKDKKITNVSSSSVKKYLNYII